MFTQNNPFLALNPNFKIIKQPLSKKLIELGSTQSDRFGLRFNW
jgi:hypothetical protein